MKIVIALGGNALGNNCEEQKLATMAVAKVIAKIINDGHDVIITHGNGPQVGMINKAFESTKDKMPFAECNAMSAGYIGYHLQNSLLNEFNRLNIKKQVSTVITQVEVDINDEAFHNPTKPIGSFYSLEEAKLLEKTNNYTMMEDSGRGYRRVVASPKPLNVIELDFINSLIEKKQIVIACGGGGIPVIKREKEINGVDAVIDKDLASALIGNLLDFDLLLILTAVPNVYLNYGKANQVILEKLNITDTINDLNNNQFGVGSMKPKVEAIINFVTNWKRKGIITNIENAYLAVQGLAGTVFTK